MGHPLEITGLIVAIMAGGIGIFFSYQLMRKYKLPFVSSYFYFLVFVYIFGVYSLAGSGMLENLMVRIDTDQEIFRSARFFTILLGIPFLILSMYMFLRCITEFLSSSLGLVFTVTYFIHAMAGFALYAFFVIRLTRFDQGEYLLLLGVQRWVFMIYYLAIFAGAFVFALFRSGKALRHQRQTIRVLTSLYLGQAVLVVGSLFASGRIEALRTVFLFFFLSWHLVPILLMNVYLGKHHGGASTVQKDFDTHLQEFCDRFEISKREREVISLISKGLSNQEISDALYISLQTVKDHIHRIFVKTGVKNRVQLTNLIRSPQTK
jgi:DNA-binding CsgD family transcriptional regulator